ncbi:MAG: hypothetical protein ACLKAL_10895 [Alkaliphilus sp.]
MFRLARQESDTGYYHIIMLGNNKIEYLKRKRISLILQNAKKSRGRKKNTTFSLVYYIQSKRTVPNDSKVRTFY